ncbi:AT-hook motif nuclear-localized protein 17-like [Nymphaea colorata]|uniref:PPC domain-containing protein n=1 Tax=Nymphaea colorata TaxID=210225 RepID=A0A5K0WYC1_9MAGN|nr:AT-hook motif nuclear-localized protein 17-like [Nymphaea colorata]
MMPQYKGHHPSAGQTSEEDDSRSSGATATTNAKRRKPTAAAVPTAATMASTTNTTNDGASIEVARKPRGRPPGSKNKPKPPIIITRDSDNAMRPHIIEVPSGCDIVEAVAQFVRRRQFGLCVMSGSGTVANVTLRQPASPGATVTFHGRFDILSLSATYLPSSSPASPTSSSIVANSGGFTISLAGAQGQVIGGPVVGSLLAAGTVIVVAASFATTSYHRLPAEDEVLEKRIQTTPPPGSGGGGGGAAVSESSAISAYTVSPTPMSCHLTPDVFWAPSARPPPPY